MPWMTRFLGVLAATLLVVLVVARNNAPGRVEAASFGLTLDTFRSNDSAIEMEGPALVDGQGYIVTLTGTFSKFPPSQWVDDAGNPSICGGTPESAPMFPSPGTDNGPVGNDVAWTFAEPVGASGCSEGHPRPATSFEISLNNRATFEHQDPVNQGTAPDSKHTYRYDVTGLGQPIWLKISDTRTDDNYGVLHIEISELQVEFTQAIQQLQTLSDLDASLAAKGHPPVPIVAGKPAVMRVMFGEVQTPTDYVLAVSGAFSGQQRTVLSPGCTAKDRRRQEHHCGSVDFFFTPPAGSWSVHLDIKDTSGNQILQHDFTITSLKTNDIVLKAVSVCELELPPPLSGWQCEDPLPLATLASLARRMYPTANVRVVITSNQVRRNIAAYSNMADWWSDVDRDLQAMYNVFDRLSDGAGQQTYYVGIISSGTGASYAAGAAFINTRGAASWDSATRLGYDVAPMIVAHEVGHAMGLDHTDTAAPTSSCTLGTRTVGPQWPYADNDLRSGAPPGNLEVGYDVANKTAIPGDLYYDMMGYCWVRPPATAPDVTGWISPFSTLNLLKPTGPLSRFGCAGSGASC